MGAEKEVRERAESGLQCLGGRVGAPILTDRGGSHGAVAPSAGWPRMVLGSLFYLSDHYVNL